MGEFAIQTYLRFDDIDYRICINRRCQMKWRPLRDAHLGGYPIV